MKKLIALTLATLMMLTLVACGGTTATETTSSETETQTEEGFVPALDSETEATLYVVGGWGNFEALDQVALDFKEYYPNVEVVYTKLDDTRADMANRFATGEEIDMFICDWWDVANVSNDDIVANAEDLNQAGIDFSNINADLLVTGENDGQQVMLPVYLQIMGYMVNLDIMDSTGVEVPIDFDSLESVAGKLTEAGYEKPIYVDSGHYKRNFVPYYLEQIENGDDDVTALDETIAKMNVLYDDGYINDEGDTLEDTYNALILRFFEGDLPIQFIPTGSFCGTAKREDQSEAFTESPFEYEFVPMSFDSDGTSYVSQTGSLYIGSYKDSKNLDITNEFLRFMFTDSEMDVLRSIKKMPTSNQNNGLDDFPYLSWDKLTYVNQNGASAETEEIANSVLKLYEYGTDNSAAYEQLDYLLENGIN